MEQKLISKVIQIDGMSCTNCETRIENALKKLEGVKKVKAIYSSLNVYITYDANVVKLHQIIQVIENLGYVVKNKPDTKDAQRSNIKNTPNKTSDEKMSVSRLVGIGVIVFAIYLIISNTAGFNFIPQINQSMGYGILFIVGMMTSLHCVAMCGGINLSVCVSYKAANENNSRLSSLKPSFLYNSGRILSYTIIGGLVGALGASISFSGAAKGIVAVISGFFMIIMGLNMLNIFPWLRKLNPRMPKFFGNKIHSNKDNYGPFFIGLLNGLMPCGPLQAMQLYALGTGSFAAGALSMFMFSLGTVPLMFGFGAVSSVISGKFTHKMMKVSAVLVIALGVVMVSRGMALSGFVIPSIPFGTGSAVKEQGVAVLKDGIQEVTSKVSPGSYEPITVQKGVPVKWIIKAGKGDINGCNNEIIIPKFNISKKLEIGDNIIEFIPAESGTYVYSCWMGMIWSKITVVDDLNNIDVSATGGVSY